MHKIKPQFSARSLLDIGIGGSKVAGIAEKKSNFGKQSKLFGKRNRSTQHQAIGSDLKAGKATEL